MGLKNKGFVDKEVGCIVMVGDMVSVVGLSVAVVGLAVGACVVGEGVGTRSSVSKTTVVA